MTREETIRQLADINPSVAKQVEALLNCKTRFCRITMKPQPSDAEKRDGKVRTYCVNMRVTWKQLMKKYYGGGTGSPMSLATLEGLRTKSFRSMLNITESVHNPKQGGSTLQCRTLVLPLIDEIKCGKTVYKF